MAVHGVGRRTAERDLAAVREQWIAGIEREQPKRRSQLLGILENALYGAMADHAWSAVVAAVRELARLSGFDSTTLHINHQALATPEELAHVRLLRMTPVQRLNRLRELESREVDLPMEVDLPIELSSPIDEPS